MIKKFIFVILLYLFVAPAFAEKIPVRITPLQLISTNHDEVEVGDWINFETAYETYLNGKLYIAKNTPVIGVVDFVHPNGWGGDKAEIWVSEFNTKDVNNKHLEIIYPIKIKNNINNYKSIKQCFYFYFLGSIRGSEVFIEPDTKTYNIFIEN